MLSFKPSILEEKVNKFLFFGKARHKAHEWVREKLGYMGRVLAQDAISDAYGVLAMIPLAACCGGGGGGHNPTPIPPSYACSDGIDNDGDTLVDMADPGCSSATDNDEYNAPTNNPPVVDAAFAPVSTPEDNPTAVAGVPSHFSDPDGDALTYSVQGFTNITAALNGNNIDISAPLNFNGTEIGSVRACDTSSACVTTPLQVTFTPVNDAPVVSGVTMYSAIEGAALDGKVNISDVDLDTVTCSLVNNGGLAELQVNPDCTITSSAPVGYNTSGTYTANVNASDGTDVTNSDITITITNVNRKPVVTDVVMTQAEELKNLTGQVVRTDADGDPTTCELVASNVTQARVDASGAVYSCSTTCTPSAPDALPRGTGGNNKTLEVRCTDGFEVSTNFTKNFRIESYPVLAGVIDAVTAEDSSKMIDVSAYASDLNSDVLTFTAACNSPVTTSVSGSQITFSSPSNFNGTRQCTITAYDPASLTGSDIIDAVFTPLSDAPALNSVTITSAKELSPLAGQINATDADIPYGDTLSYFLVSDPDGLGIEVNSSTGQVYTSGPLANGTAGPHPVTFNVIDSTFNESQLIKTINIATTNVPPVIDNVAITMSNEGSLLAGQITYHDDDGDTVTCSKVSSTLPELIVLANGQISSTGPLPRAISGTYDYEVACSDGFESDTRTGSFNVYDVTAPGDISTLAAIAASNHPEEIELHWTSPGDDGVVGTPSYFTFKYKLCPDQNDCPVDGTNWATATDIGTVPATAPAGFGYVMTFPNIPAGHVCFAGKTTDEAGNESGVSNSPCADVISKAQYYVDFWLDENWNVFLNYNEVAAMVNGEGSIPSYVSPIAAELIKCSSPSWPWTLAELEEYLTGATDGNLINGELYITHDPWYFDNDGIGNPGQVLYFEPTGNAAGFNNLPPDAVTNLTSTFREFLIQYVQNHSAEYGNLEITHNPTWQAWE